MSNIFSPSDVWISDMEIEDNHFMMHQFIDESFEFDEFGFQSWSSAGSYSWCPSPTQISPESIPNKFSQATIIESSPLMNTCFAPSTPSTENAKYYKKFSSTTTTTTGSTPKVVSFGNSDSPFPPSSKMFGDVAVVGRGIKPQDYYMPRSKTGERVKRAIIDSSSVKDPSSQAQEQHLIAERKRRAKINQRFVALSALLPGLKKSDKASVLGDPIKYMKQLQERVKTLEEEEKTTQKYVGPSMTILAKNSRSSITTNDESSSSDDSLNTQSSDKQWQQPEIEARISDKIVLIRVHCDNNCKLLVVNMLKEMEKLQLCVTSSSVLPFGNSAIDITVVAKINDGYCITVQELIEKLRQAVPKFMCEGNEPCSNRIP